MTTKSLATLTAGLGNPANMYDCYIGPWFTDAEVQGVLDAADLPLRPGLDLAGLGRLLHDAGESSVTTLRQSRAEQVRPHQRAEWCEALRDGLDELITSLGGRGELPFIDSERVAGNTHPSFLWKAASGVTEALHAHRAMVPLRNADAERYLRLQVSSESMEAREERGNLAWVQLNALLGEKQTGFGRALLDRLHDRETVLRALAGVQGLRAIAASAAVHWRSMPDGERLGKLRDPSDRWLLGRLAATFETAFGEPLEPGVRKTDDVFLKLPAALRTERDTPEASWPAFAVAAGALIDSRLPPDDRFGLTKELAYRYGQHVVSRRGQADV